MPQNILTDTDRELLSQDLNSLIEKEGTVVTEKFWKDNEHKSELAYEDNSPIPGHEFEVNTGIDSINENTALESLIIKSAIAKAKAEKDNKMSKEEQARVKKQIVDMMLYNEGEAFYQKYHYTMDGKTKRKVRRIIEKNFDKGKYNYLLTTNNLNEP